MNPLTIKIAAYAAGAVLLFGLGFGTEYRNMVAYKAEQKGITEAQVAQVKATDIKNQGDANDAQQSYAQAITSLDAYYKQHPVIKLQNNGCIAMPQTSGSASSVDGSASTWYASPFKPNDTESVAIQLFELQRLLINDGVNVQ